MLPFTVSLNVTDLLQFEQDTDLHCVRTEVTTPAVLTILNPNEKNNMSFKLNCIIIWNRLIMGITVFITLDFPSEKY